jgi:hypothetical protein
MMARALAAGTAQSGEMGRNVDAAAVAASAPGADWYLEQTSAFADYWSLRRRRMRRRRKVEPLQQPRPQR